MLLKETIKYLAGKEGWTNLFVAYVDAFNEVIVKESCYSIGYYRRFYEQLKILRDKYAIPPRTDY